MKVTVEKKEHNITELVIELPVEEVNKGFDRAYQKLAFSGYRRSGDSCVADPPNA